MRVLRLLIDDAGSLLGHQEADGHGQVVVDQRVLQALRALLRVLDLVVETGLLTQELATYMKLRKT